MESFKHQGMEYLYKKEVEHRDLKADNCLLDGNMRVKLADFGLSKSKIIFTTFTGPSSQTGLSGTVTHMAPELLLQKLFTEKCDVYSFGIVMWEVLSRAVPFAGLPQEQITARVISEKRPSPIPEDSPSQLVTLMERCWHQEPRVRFDFKEVVRKMKYAEAVIGLEEKGDLQCMLTSYSFCL